MYPESNELTQKKLAEEIFLLGHAFKPDVLYTTICFNWQNTLVCFGIIVQCFGIIDCGNLDASQMMQLKITGKNHSASGQPFTVRRHTPFINFNAF